VARADGVLAELARGERLPAAPTARRARTTSNNRATSAADRGAVGSSITITRASTNSALAISTICWSAMDRPRQIRPGSSRDAKPLEQCGGLTAHQLPVDPPPGPQRLPAHEDVLRDREIGEQGGFLVDDGDARVPGGRRGRAG